MGEKKKIVYIIGTRPEIIRSANIIKILKTHPRILFKLVHTGQHYDYLMNEVFFKELNVPSPDLNLGIGSGTHAEQTANIMLKLERFFLRFKPDLVAVFGDTNSSLAAALTAVKLQIPLAHIEAGCREWEMNLPEEINRRLIDHCSNLLLAVSEVCVQNLEKEKVLGRIYNTGDPQYDVFKNQLKKSLKLKLSSKLGLRKEEYALLTLHRDKNVDDKKNLKNILSALGSFKDLPIVFPVHPRTRKRLEKLNFTHSKMSNLIFLDPLGYQEFLNLLANSKMVITDSGGVQKEAFWARIPCITLREHTGWVETVGFRVNYLAGTDRKKIITAMHHVTSNYRKIKATLSKVPNPYAQKNTTKKIVELLKIFGGKKWLERG